MADRDSPWQRDGRNVEDLPDPFAAPLFGGAPKVRKRRWWKRAGAAARRRRGRRPDAPSTTWLDRSEQAAAFAQPAGRRPPAPAAPAESTGRHAAPRRRGCAGG